MNWSYFGMTRPAFRPVVDTEAYFPAASQETAIVTIRTAFDRREPAVLIDGPCGVGKSLVARRWLGQLPSHTRRVMLPSAQATKPGDLLQAILFDWNLPYQGLSEQELRLAVTAELLRGTETGLPTALLLDEAQYLSQPALEELRLLGNIETREGSVLFVLLVAQPTLRNALNRPAYEAFSQRVAFRCAIEPLTMTETVAYLKHQIQLAGVVPEHVFDDAALTLLASSCGGLPRVLNQAATLAAEMAQGNETPTIDFEAAYEALTQLGCEIVESEESTEPTVLQHPSRSENPARPTTSKPGKRMREAAGDDPPPAATPKEKSSRKRSA